MKNTTNKICLVYVIFSMILLSYSCDDPTSSNLSYLNNNHQKEQVEIEGEPETIFSEEGVQQDTGIIGEEPTVYNEPKTVSSTNKSGTTTSKENKTDTTVSQPSNSKETETQSTASTGGKENASISSKKDLLANQDGNKVRMCVTYLGNENGTPHFCDDKRFYFTINNEEKRYPLKFNNLTTRYVGLYGIKKGIDIGYQFSENTDAENTAYLKEKYTLLTDSEIAFLLPHIKAGHVPGTIFPNITWKNNKITIKTECIDAYCHEDVATISVIGEVVDKNGVTEYLRAELKPLHLKRTVEYTFDDFELVNKDYDFDSYCRFIEITQ